MAERRLVWTDAYEVRAHEVAAHGRASTPAICNWLQETAGNHARHLGWGIERLMGQGMTWVLSRLHLVLDRAPAWRDAVRVTTWPAGAHRLFAVREFTVAADAGECGRATTGWIVVKVANRRPMRPPADVEAMGRLAPPRVIADGFSELPPPERSDLERAVEVRYADLDMNRHANNVSVIAWALEALPAEIALGATLCELEADFRAEALHGDRIVVRAQREDGRSAAFRHLLAREGDGREIARLRTVWSADAV